MGAGGGGVGGENRSPLWLFFGLMAFRGIGLEKNWARARLVFKILSFINPGLGRY